MSHIFISYSRRDLAFAQKIVDALAANDLDTWIDWKSIPKGEDWEQEIYRGIEEADAFLFLLSPGSVASEMCNKEIAHAVKNGKRILPIVIRDTDPNIIHPEISKRNWIFCRDSQDDFKKAIEEIQKTIHTDYEWMKFHTDLQVKALKWEQKKDTSRFLRGKELQEAEQQFANTNTKDPPPTDLQRRYLLLSQQDKIRKKNIALAIILIAILVIAVLGFYGRYQALKAIEDRNRARVQELINLSKTMIEKSASSSILLAVEAINIEQPPISSEQNLMNILAQTGGEVISNNEKYLGASATGQKIATVSNINNSIHIWTIGEHDISFITLRGVSNLVSEVSFSPNEKFLVLVERSFTVRLWAIDAEPKELFVFTDEAYYVYYREFSADGRWLAISSSQGIFLIDLFSSPIKKIVIPSDVKKIGLAGKVLEDTVIERPLFSSNGKWLFTLDVEITSSEHIRGWHLGEIELQMTPILFNICNNPGQSGCQIFSIDISKASKQLVVGADNGNLLMWSLEENRSSNSPLTLFRWGGYLSQINSNTNHQLLIVEKKGSGDEVKSSLHLVEDMSQPNPNSILLSQDILGNVRIFFSPNNQWLAATSEDGNIYLWDLSNGEIVSTKTILHVTDHTVTTMTFSYDGKWLISGSGNKIQIWDLQKTDIDKSSITLHTDGEIKHIVVDKKSNWFITISEEIRLWQLNPVTTNPGSSSQLLAMGSIPTASTFSPDGKWLVEGDFDGHIKVWKIGKIGPDSFVNFSLNCGGVSAVKFSPDSQWLVTVCINGSARLWKMNNSIDDPSPILLEGNDYQYSVDFDPTSNWLAIGRLDGKVAIWNVSNLSIDPIILQNEPIGLENFYISVVLFSPDGEWLSVGSGNQLISPINLWNFNALKKYQAAIPIKLPFTDGIRKMLFTRDGKWLLAASNSYLKAWNIHQIDYSGSETAIVQDGYYDLDLQQAIIRTESYITDFALSSDEKLVAVAGKNDGTVNIWELSKLDSNAKFIELETYYTLRGHNNQVFLTLFSPDGKLLITSSDDGSIRLWDPYDENGDNSIILQQQKDGSLIFTISPDSRWLISGNLDGRLLLWPLQKFDIGRIACNVAGRNFTQSEWNRYFFNQPYRFTCSQWPAASEPTITPTP